jgi:hypothetical protein
MIFIILRREIVVFAAYVTICIVITCVTAEESSIPDMTGNWSGTSVGHYNEIGYIEEGFFDDTLMITYQNGQIFNGRLLESGGQGDKSYTFAGVIGPDMKTIYITEYEIGRDIGFILDENTLEIILQVEGEKGLAELCRFTRSNYLVSGIPSPSVI